MNGEMFKAYLEDFMMNALFINISGNIDAEEQRNQKSMLCTVCVVCPLMDFKL